MDIFGNPQDWDIHGNTIGHDVFGIGPDTNGHGNSPADVFGNYSPVAAQDFGGDAHDSAWGHSDA